MSRGIFLAAAATLTVLSSWTAVSAMPALVGASLKSADAAITRVQYYQDYTYGSPLELPGALIGGTLGLLTGTLGNDYYPQTYPYYGTLEERYAACAANYISFDPTTGTYTTYEGFQVLCPFLR